MSSENISNRISLNLFKYEPMWTDHVDGGWHAVGLVLIWKVCHVDGVQVGDVVYVLLARQWCQRVTQSIEPLADVGVHVNINTAHFPKHIQSPGTSTTAFCLEEEERMEKEVEEN